MLDLLLIFSSIATTTILIIKIAMKILRKSNKLLDIISENVLLLFSPMVVFSMFSVFITRFFVTQIAVSDFKSFLQIMINVLSGIFAIVGSFTLFFFKSLLDDLETSKREMKKVKDIMKSYSKRINQLRVKEIKDFHLTPPIQSNREELTSKMIELKEEAESLSTRIFQVRSKARWAILSFILVFIFVGINLIYSIVSYTLISHEPFISKDLFESHFTMFILSFCLLLWYFSRMITDII